jgi:hypothetical protein
MRWINFFMEESDIERIEVAESRLKGDINRSYSGDIISPTSYEGKSLVRNPFKFKGEMWVSTGGSWMGEHCLEQQCYRLQPRKLFTGEIREYTKHGERTEDDVDGHEAWRNDPLGFYHGMLVWWGKEECVLVGPKVQFVPEPGKAPAQPKQLQLL